MNYFKKCTKCLEWKDFSDFGRARANYDGLSTQCRKCLTRGSLSWYGRNKEKCAAVHKSWASRNKEKHAAAMLRWRRKNPEADRNRHLMRYFKISNDEFKRILATQGGACAICRSKPNKHLSVDHDHTTGAVRGLLCGSCNRGIGLLKDNSNILRSAAEYLEKRKLSVAV